MKYISGGLRRLKSQITGKYPLEQIGWQVTHRCNGNCRIMCPFPEKQEKEGAEKMQKEEITLDQWKTILNDLPDTVNYIHLTGGEPFLRKDIFELIEASYARFPDLIIQMPSNGFLTDRIINVARRVFTEIKPKNGFSLGLSLDGIKEIEIDGKRVHTHDYIRGTPGAFKKTMKTFEELLSLREEVGEKRMFTGFGMVIHPFNIDQIWDEYLLAKKNHADFVAVMVTHDDWSVQEKVFTKEQLDEIDMILKRVAADIYKDRADFPFHPHSVFLANEVPVFRKQKWYKCLAAQNFCVIDPIGNLNICVAAKRCLGNLKEHSFSTLWNSKLRQDIVENFLPHCRCWGACHLPINISYDLLGCFRGSLEVRSFDKDDRALDSKMSKIP